MNLTAIHFHCSLCTWHTCSRLTGNAKLKVSEQDLPRQCFLSIRFLGFDYTMRGLQFDPSIISKWQNQYIPLRFHVQPRYICTLEWQYIPVEQQHLHRFRHFESSFSFKLLCSSSEILKYDWFKCGQNIKYTYNY